MECELKVNCTPKLAKLFKALDSVLPEGEKAPHAKITNDTAEYIRELYLMGGFTAAMLAKLYNVTHQSIENLLNNRTYKSKTETARRAAIAISTKPRCVRYKPTEAEA